MLIPLAQAAEVKLELRLQEGCIIRCTEDDLYQIAFNLMENAIKYNRPGGQLDVIIRRNLGNAEIIFSDTGIGIPAEHHARIFERFYRVDKTGQKKPEVRAWDFRL